MAKKSKKNRIQDLIRAINFIAGTLGATALELKRIAKSLSEESGKGN